ncbi:MAG: hypothetical protein LBT74_05890 [Acidobacteriota bacterium]|nr:hypothetical protein [Acidobacteriota bacterium]
MTLPEPHEERGNHLTMQDFLLLLTPGEQAARLERHLSGCPRCELIYLGLTQPVEPSGADDAVVGDPPCEYEGKVHRLVYGAPDIVKDYFALRHLKGCERCRGYVEFLGFGDPGADALVEGKSRRFEDAVAAATGVFADFASVFLGRPPVCAPVHAGAGENIAYSCEGEVVAGVKAAVRYTDAKGVLEIARDGAWAGEVPEVTAYEDAGKVAVAWSAVTAAKLTLEFNPHAVTLVSIRLPGVGSFRVLELCPIAALRKWAE